ncbi:alpha amylase family protein [Methylocaldum marinum]|uniref:Alpha amylase family protein n=1 Tax=Methylocaldum marinum TaxID=1432792 RepID=A0A250KRT6_9GAMM|nr:alpha-amylase family glycosyl hydrolase [Methylocaldum marinum]BBA34282.1 alpha amylase family protein [Methylocaldum marinum]
MKIYNLFPRLAGPFHRWQPHLERAADMGFDWIFVNPVQKLGRSRSLYSIKDYFQIDSWLLKPRSPKSPEDQLRAVVSCAEGLGLGMIVDLVINHCAYDSPLLKQHPEWFVKQGRRIAHPYCLHEGEKVVWRDLAQFDHQHTSDPEGLYRYCREIVEYLLGLGFKGLRCDAAYQLPGRFWARLIEETKRTHPETVFLAETLGCSAEQTRETAQAGFDFIFNSSKWWDFSNPWLLDQYRLTREIVPSISFPESHDTVRAFAEFNRNVDAVRQRYFFTALFSAGVMIPMGFEFGFQKPLHVVETTPDDWENTDIDLTGYIKQINRIKSVHPVFDEESATQVLEHANPEILLMRKSANRERNEALIILNKDPWNRQNFFADNLYHLVQSEPPLLDVSPEWPLDYLPTPFQFELTPGMGRILVTQ